MNTKGSDTMHECLLCERNMNLAYVSVGLGVIKEYEIYIKFCIEDYEVN